MEQLDERRFNPVIIGSILAGVLIGIGLIIFLSSSSTVGSSYNDKRLNYWQQEAKDKLAGTPKVLDKYEVNDDEGRWRRLYVLYPNGAHRLLDFSRTHMSYNYVNDSVEPGGHIAVIAGTTDNDRNLKTKRDDRKAVRYVVIEPAR
jgi:hypothetical protein